MEPVGNIVHPVAAGALDPLGRSGDVEAEHVGKERPESQRRAGERGSVKRLEPVGVVRWSLIKAPSCGMQQQ
jgi:hypothetical protein